MKEFKYNNELLQIGFVRNTFLEDNKEKTLYSFGLVTDDCGYLNDAIIYDPIHERIKCNHGSNVYFNDESRVYAFEQIVEFIENRGIKPKSFYDISKTLYEVILVNPGPGKLACVKAIKEATGKGLKESKQCVDNAPCSILKGLSKRKALEIKDFLKEYGSGIEVEIK